MLIINLLIINLLINKLSDILFSFYNKTVMDYEMRVLDLRKTNTDT